MKFGVEGIRGSGCRLVNNHPLDRVRTNELVSTILADDLHAKRWPRSRTPRWACFEGAAPGIHAIGRALAFHSGLDSRHAVKQVDRLFSNTGIDVWLWVAKTRSVNKTASRSP